VRAKHFNSVLRRTENTPEEYMVHTAVLRAQMQAFYHPENTGHFGLSLAKYCHFTSPIRRYADLVVHRALIGTLDKKAAQALSKADRKPLAAIAEHISMTERRAMLAERDTADRYKVVFMSARLGETFRATVTGINGYGLFATIGEFGVTGFIPIRALGDGYFRFDERHRILRSNRGNETYRLGQELAIVVEEANKLTGNLLFSLQERQRQSRPLREKKRPPRQKHRPKR
jgi:ribonuclease R